MKLRVKGNTIRLRLTQGEVDAFRDSGRVSERVDFTGQGSVAFEYRLERCSGSNRLDAEFTENTLTVKVPADLAGKWTSTNLIGFDNKESEEVLPALYILVEKDFQCLHKRPHEDESDHFPNPMAGA